MSGRDANQLADRKNLDLVKISPNARPPVCKIMDYGKYKFDLKKKEKESKKNQHETELKEVWLSMTIEKHDLDTKARNARKFILDGDKVKVSLRMRGRQQAHAKLGLVVMQDFFSFVEDIAQYDKVPSTEGRAIVMILSPAKDKPKAKEQVAKPNTPLSTVTQTVKPNNAVNTVKPVATATSVKPPLAKPMGANNARPPVNTARPAATNNTKPVAKPTAKPFNNSTNNTKNPLPK